MTASLQDAGRNISVRGEFSLEMTISLVHDQKKPHKANNSYSLIKKKKKSLENRIRIYHNVV